MCVCVCVCAVQCGAVQCGVHVVCLEVSGESCCPSSPPPPPTGRLPYYHVRAEHVRDTIVSGGKLTKPDGCNPEL